MQQQVKGCDMVKVFVFFFFLFKYFYSCKEVELIVQVYT